MSFLKKLLRRQEPLAPPERPQGLCLHVTLVPRWDTPEDMGNEARTSRFVCSACSTSFNPEEARGLRASEAERLRNVVGS